MDRGAWWATVHRVAQSQTQLKQLSMHTRTNYDRKISVVSASEEVMGFAV